MRIIAAVLVSIFIVSCSAGDEVKKTAKIYYIPIGMETFIPITKENIEEHEFSYGDQDVSTSDFDKLQKLIKGARAGSFNNDRVRVKIVLPDRSVVFVDNEGGVEVAGEQSKLSDSKLQEVKELLDEMTERVVRQRS